MPKISPAGTVFGVNGSVGAITDVRSRRSPTPMEVPLMNTKAGINCNCGQRIIAKDVLQKGQYLRLFGPSFIYVKFRCSRCKRLGEKFIEQDKWDDALLRDIPSEFSSEEKKSFDRLGPISINEVIDFHQVLENFRFEDMDPNMEKT
jgi:DNA-directed RNA polymerase subunit RPC12/RpoP